MLWAFRLTSLPHFSAALGAPRPCICVHGTEWTWVLIEFLGQTCMRMPPPALALSSNASLLRQSTTSPCSLEHHLALLPLSLLSFLFSFQCPDTWVFSLPRVKGCKVPSPHAACSWKQPPLMFYCYSKARRSFCSPPLEGPMAPDIDTLSPLPSSHLPMLPKATWS